MRTRELKRRKYLEIMKESKRFACAHYYGDTCPHYEDTCECPRNDGHDLDFPRDKDICSDFVPVSARRYHAVMEWARDELLEALYKAAPKRKAT